MRVGEGESEAKVRVMDLNDGEGAVEGIGDEVRFLLDVLRVQQDLGDLHSLLLHSVYLEGRLGLELGD